MKMLNHWHTPETNVMLLINCTPRKKLVPILDNMIVNISHLLKALRTNKCIDCLCEYCSNKRMCMNSCSPEGSFLLPCFCLPWSDGTGCHDLSFLNVEFSASCFTLPISPSSRGSLAPLHWAGFWGVDINKCRNQTGGHIEEDDSRQRKPLVMGSMHGNQCNILE